MRIGVASLIVLLFAVGCAEQAPAADASKTAPVPAPAASPAKVAPAATAPAITGALGQAVAAYEVMQQKLTADDGTAAIAQLEPLLVAAKLAANEGKEPSKATLTTFADVVQKAVLEKPSDLKAVRAHFGVISQALVAVFVADKTLQAGRFIFECPMVKGYQKWIQPHGKLLNPYFGSEMLECGSKASWT